MGLSIEQTGLYTSERHEQARRDGKLTAGQAAAIIRARLGSKVSAKETVSAFGILFGCEPEWHHSGFYRPQGGRRKTMGRTFFFSIDQIEELISRWPEVAQRREEAATIEAKKATTMVKGFYYKWRQDYGGYRGKKRNYKVLQSYEGIEADAPRNFQVCSDEQHEAVKAAVGRAYYGWDEPTLSEFTL